MSVGLISADNHTAVFHLKWHRVTILFDESVARVVDEFSCNSTISNSNSQFNRWMACMWIQEFFMGCVDCGKETFGDA